MKVVAVVAVLAGCGRLGFDATKLGGGADGSGGGGDGSGCVDPPVTKHVPADGDFYTVVQNLQPGDVVEVSGGPYTSPGGAVHQTWPGIAAKPIIVRAAPSTRPVLDATPGNNVLDLDGAYFDVRGFELVSDEAAACAGMPVRHWAGARRLRVVRARRLRPLRVRRSGAV